METTPNNHIPQAAENPELPQAAAPPGAANGQSSSLEKSLEKIERHRQAAYQSQNTQVAVLGGVSADLLEVEARVAHALRETLSGGAWTTNDIEGNAGAIDLIIRLSKQAGQIGQLEERISRTIPVAIPLPFLQAKKMELAPHTIPE